jgi:phosphoribosylanthranilate isomerase
VTRIKICGITEAPHALAAAQAGADFIGMVFAPSRRRVSIEKAREIASVVKRLKACPQVVGVFVNTPPSEVNHIAEYCGLDWVQLSGDEPWDYLGEIEKQVIKAVRVRSQQDSEDIIAEINSGRQLPGQSFICLLDCHVEGSYGGTGKTFDWRLASQVSHRFPVIIAGGLSPQNVGEAIQIARPWGVDVSSGVETKGVKDASKIERFIQTVRMEDGR